MSRPRRREDEPVVTQEMIGLFVAFGGDIILLLVLLAVLGVASWTVALGVSGVILAVFGLWAVERWRRLRSRTDDGAAGLSEQSEGETALETLKSQYAAGEITDETFEAKLDRLLESDREHSTHSENEKTVTTTHDETLEDRR